MFIFRLIAGLKFKNIYKSVIVNTIFQIVDDDRSTFFGYYNISPFNLYGDYLFCSTRSKRLPIYTEEPVHIMLYKKKENKFEKLSKSRSWNWQQGCMLQWLGNDSTKLIYNNFSNNKYCSEVINLKTNEKRKYNLPIYTVATHGEFGFSLNFSRLAKYRPDYGYFNKEFIKQDDNNNDGIFKINLKENKSSLFISMKEIINFKKQKSMITANHRVNHLDINPENKKLIFLHRWSNKDTQYMRLLLADCLTAKLHLIHENKMISHYSWLNNHEIICFCSSDEISNRYFVINIKTKDYKALDFMPHEDGHPTISPNKKWVLTDTYPDKCGYSKIYITNLQKKKTYWILSVFQPLKFRGQMRCDLHPRWDRINSYISFDSCHNGYRSFYLIKINWDKIYNE